MFTGIVKGLGRISGLQRSSGLVTFDIELPSGAETDLEIGASVAVDGVCLTVTSTSGPHATFDVMQETLTRTTLGDLREGSAVNIERAARDGAEIGGHPLSGHIDCVVTVAEVQTPENNRVLTLAVPAPWIRYVFAKGYIALNGASLTVASVDKRASTFTVWLIPETLRMTTFGDKLAGARINMEIERSTQVTVDTIRDFLEERLGPLLPRLESLAEELADASAAKLTDGRSR
ncbi:riboflavin synthase subunit alpha [Povalibacter sp.]|uniref:riboflavin synthase subunit alpha n=1 Tax=Povalibacter sp. TaxID=1962978 RepID=UPI002F409F8D